MLDAAKAYTNVCNGWYSISREYQHPLKGSTPCFVEIESRINAVENCYAGRQCRTRVQSELGRSLWYFVRPYCCLNVALVMEHMGPFMNWKGKERACHCIKDHLSDFLRQRHSYCDSFVIEGSSCKVQEYRFEDLFGDSVLGHFLLHGVACSFTQTFVFHDTRL